MLDDKFHSRRTHHSAHQRILFLNRFHNEPQERSILFNLSTFNSAKNNRREFYLEIERDSPPGTNEISFKKRIEAESGDRSKGMNPGPRSLGHFVDETCRNHDTSSPFTNCKGAANMRDWNFAKQPRASEAFAKAFAEGLPGERNLRPAIQKGNLSIGSLRDALRKTRRGPGSRDPRERHVETRVLPSWNRLYYLPLDVDRRLHGPFFLNSKGPNIEKK